MFQRFLVVIHFNDFNFIKSFKDFKYKSSTLCHLGYSVGISRFETQRLLRPVKKGLHKLKPCKSFEKTLQTFSSQSHQKKHSAPRRRSSLLTSGLMHLSIPAAACRKKGVTRLGCHLEFCDDSKSQSAAWSKLRRGCECHDSFRLQLLLPYS